MPPCSSPPAFPAIPSQHPPFSGGCRQPLHRRPVRHHPLLYRPPSTRLRLLYRSSGLEQASRGKGWEDVTPAVAVCMGIHWPWLLVQSNQQAAAPALDSDCCRAGTGKRGKGMGFCNSLCLERRKVLKGLWDLASLSFRAVCCCTRSTLRFLHRGSGLEQASGGKVWGFL